jgi:hypothetical protein
MFFRVAGSRAETHYGHLAKSLLEFQHRSGLWPDLFDYFGLVSSCRFSASLRRISTVQETCCQFLLKVPNAVSIIYCSSFVHLCLLVHI